MTILQMVLIALFVYLSSIGTPWFLGTTGGWACLARPLIGSFIVGLIMGDMPTALAIGVALQAMYLGVITPGAVLQFDVSFVGYLAPALAIAAKSNAPVAMAVTIAVPIGLLGVLLWNTIYFTNTLTVRVAERYAEQGNIKGMKIANIYLGQTINFVFRFVPAFLLLLFASNAIQSVFDAIPPFVQTYLNAVTSVLPALGIGLLLTMISKRAVDLGVFVVGFVLVTYLNLPIIPVAIIGVVLAGFYYMSQSGKTKEAV